MWGFLRECQWGTHSMFFFLMIHCEWRKFVNDDGQGYPIVKSKDPFYICPAQGGLALERESSNEKIHQIHQMHQVNIISNDPSWIPKEFDQCCICPREASSSNKCGLNVILTNCSSTPPWPNLTKQTKMSYKEHSRYHDISHYLNTGSRKLFSSRRTFKQRQRKSGLSFSKCIHGLYKQYPLIFSTVGALVAIAVLWVSSPSCLSKILLRSPSANSNSVLTFPNNLS